MVQNPWATHSGAAYSWSSISRTYILKSLQFYTKSLKHKKNERQVNPSGQKHF